MVRTAHDLLTRITRHQTSLVAAGVAFYGTLALVPALSMLVSLYGLLFNPRSAAAQLSLVQDLLPPEAWTLISRQVHRLVNQNHRTLGLSLTTSLLATFWSAAAGTKSMLAALNLAQGHPESRSVLRFQVIGLALTFTAMLAGVLTLALLVALPACLEFLGASTHDTALFHTLSFALLLLFVAFLLAGLYRFGPARHPGRVLPGAVVGTTLWLAATYGFTGLTETVFRLSGTYGPLATAAGLMLWFWVSAYATLFGAEINAVLADQPRERA